MLVTSRVDQPDFVPVPLELLDPELSLQLLTQEAGQSPQSEENAKAAREISEKLGGLPLALELAKALLDPAEESDLELKANLLTDLCTIYVQLGRYQEARNCGEEALAIRLKLFGDHNSETAMSFHNVGATLRILGETEKSLEYHQKALAIWRELHGENHIDTALALDGASANYFTLGKKEEALEFAERALAIRENVLGHVHPDTANSYCNVGSLCAAFGQHSRALQYEEKALAIANELFGTQSPLKASVLKNIGFAHSKQMEFGKALEAALKSLAMRRELFGDQHPDTLRVLTDVAVTYFDMGRVHQGFQLLDEHLKRIPSNHSQYPVLKEQIRDFQTRYPRPGFRRPPSKRR